MKDRKQNRISGKMRGFFLIFSVILMFAAVSAAWGESSSLQKTIFSAPEAFAAGRKGVLRRVCPMEMLSVSAAWGEGERGQEKSAGTEETGRTTGKLSAALEEKIPCMSAVCSLLYDPTSDCWYYTENGLVNRSYTGLVSYAEGWFYVEKGVLNWDYTGLTCYNGGWFYVEKGVLNWDYTGLTCYNGGWFYVEKGVLNWDYTGLTCYNEGWFYVEKGVLNWDYTGLTFYEGTWFYVEGGMLTGVYTGLTCYNGGWFYVEKGQLNWDYTGLTCYDGAWFYVEGGVLNWDYTGLTCYDGAWFYVEKGVLNWDYTGLTCYQDVWFYVEGGALTGNYTGLTCYQDAWFYVEKGNLNWNYTGMVLYNGTWFYVEKGVLNWGYTGQVLFNGSTLYVENGVLKSGEINSVSFDGSRYHMTDGVCDWAYTALHVSGGHLADAYGNPVLLQGVSTHGLAWYPQYVNQELFTELRNTWKADVVRLAVYTAEYGGYCSGGDKAQLKKQIDEGVQYAYNAGMYVIIDWHILSDGNPTAYQSEAIAFFSEMAQKYASYPNVIYEICNEPNGGTSWTTIKAYAENVIKAIRQYDDAVIIVGTPNWCQYIGDAAANPITMDSNIMYSLHFYSGTHKSDLRNQMIAAAQAGLPIFVTEYGVCDASGNGGLDTAEAARWIAALKQLKISYCCWSLSNKAETASLIASSCQKTSGFAYAELSAAGQWVYTMMTGQTALEGSDSSGITNPSVSPSGSGNSSGGEDSGSQEDGVMLSTQDFDIQLTAVNSWESGGSVYTQYSCEITNLSGKKGSEWEIVCSFSEDIAIESGWNGIYSAEGSTLTIHSADYNGSVAAGGCVTDIGFIVRS